MSNCWQCRYGYLSARYANDGPDDALIECRRYAPKPTSVADDPYSATEWEWPLVYPGDWCGEFASRSRLRSYSATVSRETISARLPTKK